MKLRILIVATACASLMSAPGRAAGGAELGSAEFFPTSEQPVGWRGDGTGRYPGATPPTAWGRKLVGGRYATKGIVWMTPLPNKSVSSPIIVGDRIFVTTEVSDLTCINKRTGRILWIRSNPEFEGVPAEERRSNPAYAALERLLPKMSQCNTDVAAALNALQATSRTSALGPLPPAVVRKRDLDKELKKLEHAVDREKFERNWAQEVFGFSGPTPTSDGKHVFVFYTTGIVACYDMQGNRLWINRGGTGMSEHGNFASPLLRENRLVVWAGELRGYDAATGRLLWDNPADAGNTYGSLFCVRAGGEQVACFQSGYFARLRDGKPIWGERVLGDAVSTPIAEGPNVYAWVGYPRNNHEKLGFKAFKFPASAEGKWPAAAYTFVYNWKSTELPEDKKHPFDRSYTASPLYVGGRIYQMTQGGGLTVHNAATGELIYRKLLPMKPHTEYWNWAGASASPTLAGQFIYLMDNQGTTVIVRPGDEYVEVARNVIEELGDDKGQVQNLATPIFEGSRIYYRTPGYLYCIGDR